MKFERKLRNIGGSLVLVIPADLGRYLNLNVGDDLIVQDDDGKHGKFISFWKKKNEHRT